MCALGWAGVWQLLVRVPGGPAALLYADCLKTVPEKRKLAQESSDRVCLEGGRLVSSLP